MSRRSFTGVANGGSYPPLPLELSSLLRPSVPALLVLADGSSFAGRAAAPAEATGEVVFNTSMFGYQEMVSDPSYRGQILVLTAPHIGTVGANEDDLEGRRAWVEALIVSDLTFEPSNWRSRGALPAFLEDQGAPVAWGFDTRALVLHLRERGALPGVLACGDRLDPEALAARARAAHGTDGLDLTGDVTRASAEAWEAGPWMADRPRSEAPGPVVTVLDCGVKRSILRQLVGAGARVTAMPAEASAEEILAGSPDGVVISNGPGDPAAVGGAVETIRGLTGRVPVLGICLGHQLLALALGGGTYKLRFGHHGGNHPVRDEATGAVWITSQNHNYAVDATSLPEGVRVSMVNLTDGSVEGIVAESLGAEGIQFHPEAGPGPHDALGVFPRFVERCRGRR